MAQADTGDSNMTVDETTGCHDDATNSDTTKEDDSSTEQTKDLDRTSELESDNSASSPLATADLESRNQTEEIKANEGNDKVARTDETADVAKGESVPDTDAAETDVKDKQEGAISSENRQDSENVEDGDGCQNAAEIGTNVSDEDDTAGTSKLQTQKSTTHDDAYTEKHEPDATVTVDGRPASEDGEREMCQNAAEVGTAAKITVECDATNTCKLQTSQSTAKGNLDDEDDGRRRSVTCEQEAAADAAKENSITAPADRDDERDSAADRHQESCQEQVGDEENAMCVSEDDKETVHKDDVVSDKCGDEKTRKQDDEEWFNKEAGSSEVDDLPSSNRNENADVSGEIQPDDTEALTVKSEEENDEMVTEAEVRRPGESASSIGDDGAEYDDGSKREMCQNAAEVATAAKIAVESDATNTCELQTSQSTAKGNLDDDDDERSFKCEQEAAADAAKENSITAPADRDDEHDTDSAAGRHQECCQEQVGDEQNAVESGTDNSPDSGTAAPPASQHEESTNACETEHGDIKSDRSLEETPTDASDEDKSKAVSEVAQPSTCTQPDSTTDVVSTNHTHTDTDHSQAAEISDRDDRERHVVSTTTDEKDQTTSSAQRSSIHSGNRQLLPLNV